MENSSKSSKYSILIETYRRAAKAWEHMDGYRTAADIVNALCNILEKETEEPDENN